MAGRPVCLTYLVKATPPPDLHGDESVGKAMAIRFRATLAVGLWMVEQHSYVCLQDCSGKIWVVHRDNPFGVFLPPGGRLIFIARGGEAVYHTWFGKIFAAARAIGQKPLTTIVPHHVAVKNWYAGFDDGVNSDCSAESQAQIPLRAVNAYVAFRTWFNDDIKFGNYHLTQGQISSLCSDLWAADPVKGIWSKIAAKYTANRDQGIFHYLPDFVRVEFMKLGIILKGSKIAESIGSDLEIMKRKGRNGGTGLEKGSPDFGPMQSVFEDTVEVTRLDLDTTTISDDSNENVIQGMTVTIPEHLRLSHEEAANLIKKRQNIMQARDLPERGYRD
uniref:Putative mating type 1-1-1 protein n=1 Tax=Phymatotrichopsis omnivora TaxID=231936 RepID=A0A8B0M3X2_9PEZI|nr:putative mating type 1-1-1 protein [Phymatotrichopsis omnivora]